MKQVINMAQLKQIQINLSKYFRKPHSTPNLSSHKTIQSNQIQLSYFFKICKTHYQKIVEYPVTKFTFISLSICQQYQSCNNNNSSMLTILIVQQQQQQQLLFLYSFTQIISNKFAHYYSHFLTLYSARLKYVKLTITKQWNILLQNLHLFLYQYVNNTNRVITIIVVCQQYQLYNNNNNNFFFFFLLLILFQTNLPTIIHTFQLYIQLVQNMQNSLLQNSGISYYKIYIYFFINMLIILIVQQQQQQYVNNINCDRTTQKL
eukprot:TRINITY_DN2054_c0_g1_i7.p1 TRINITY_DN2054_c0_g1~~TRINITY_DN2054_c0_g1_i7.p1  ORF type:complete len:262 (+),score=-35.26 TRINITY_DN2054_c0_g1_i7:233-1018(+)